MRAVQFKQSTNFLNRPRMVSQYRPAVSQNVKRSQKFASTIVSSVLYAKLKICSLLKLRYGSLSQTIKKH